MDTQFIIVWGMHRSGTSLLARSLMCLGADLGMSQGVADSHNEKGYFEDVDVLNLNREMLRHLGLRWDSLSDVGETQVKILQEAGFLEQARELLIEKARGKTLLGLKDPPMTRLGLFWGKVFMSLDIKPLSVIAFRNPAAVVKSLRRRAAKINPNSFVMDTNYGQLLWLGYTLDAIHHTRAYPRVLIDYGRFLANPGQMLQAMAQKLSMSINNQELKSFCDEFVDKNLDHNQGQAARIRLLPKVSQLYETLLNSPRLECPDNDQVGPIWPATEMEKVMAGILDQALRESRETHKYLSSLTAHISSLSARLEELQKRE